MTIAKKRIMIVDDEVGFTRLLKLNLEQIEGYAACEVNLASQALPAALHFRPDLVLLDVMMPGIDGGGVAARLEAHPETREIPIVFVTAAVKRDEVASHQGLIGGLRYIAKPVDLPDLLKCIHGVLANTSPTRTGVPLAAAGP